MTEDHKSLMVVSVDPDVFARFPPLLWRTSFDVSTPRDPRLALKAISQTRYSLIITAYPLEKLRFQSFLDEVRGFGCPCRSAGLLCLTSSDRVAEAEAFVGWGLNRVVATDCSDEELGEAIADLLEVPARAAVRISVSIGTQLWRKSRSVLTQTINVSRTGMLLRAPPGSFAIGEKFTFHFTLPDSGKAISGRGVVMRVATGKRDGGPGLGVRFASFQGKGERLLWEFLDKVLH